MIKKKLEKSEEGMIMKIAFLDILNKSAVVAKICLLLFVVLFFIGCFLYIVTPWVGLGIITAVYIAIFFIIYRQGNQFDEKYGARIYHIAYRFLGKDDFDLKQGSCGDKVVVCLLVLFGFIIAIAGIFMANDYREKHNARIQAAIVEGAPQVVINGFCVDKKVYVKDNEGNFIYLSINDRRFLECRDKPSVEK